MINLRTDLLEWYNGLLDVCIIRVIRVVAIRINRYYIPAEQNSQRRLS